MIEPPPGPSSPRSREAVRALLLEGRGAELASAAPRDREVVRSLLRLLQDREPLVRHRAAAALGRIAAASFDAVAHVASRLSWAMNDESGMSCDGAALGIAEIAAARPEETRGFARVVLHHLDDDTHRQEILFAMVRLAPAFREDVADVAPEVEALLADDEPAVRALAARVLAAIGRVPPGALALCDDATPVRLWDGSRLEPLTVGEAVRRALSARGAPR